ncbi:hypothetical protein ACN27G_27620 [Plantactinospora sp. WMMB334]|uniref:hypothetical protein n=1 Tax=Plantactinospora sp. WMMB334 TaxID=3404119 RepID=UPI003B94BA11
MARRRVAVEFIAELGQFRRGTRDGADQVRKFRDESKAAQVEVRNLARESVRAQQDLRRFADGRRQLVDVGAAVRSARQDMAALADRTRKLANDFAAVNGTVAAALATFRRLPAAAQAAGRSIRNVDLGEAARTARAAASGVGEIGGRASLASVVGLAAIPTTAAAAAAALQTIPPVLGVIGGGLGAIPGLAAGAAGSIGTLKLATAGLGDSIEEIFETPDGVDPYTRLSASGQKLVDVIAGQRNALLGLRRVAQDQVFAGLDAEVTALAGTVLPFAERQVVRFGTTWNQTFRQLSRVGQDQQFLAGLDAAFDSADRFFDGVNLRIPTTARALSQLFRTSQPYVDRFGGSLLSYVDDFNAWIDDAAGSGDLTRFFSDAAEQADALLDIGKEVLVLVGRIGGLPYGGDTLRDMADALERFNDEAHNMRSVEGVIATGNAAVRGLVDVLVILGETLGETLADPATRDAVVAFFDILGVAAQVVSGLVQAFAALPGPVQSTVLVLAALLIVVGKLRGAATTMGVAVGTATDRLDRMGPAGQRASRGLRSVASAAGKVGGALLALQVAGVVFDQFDDSATKVEALNRSLTKFTQTGELSGELTRLFGQDLNQLGKEAHAAGDGWLPKIGRSLEAILPPLKVLNEEFQDGSFTGAAQRFREVDEQLRNIGETTGDVNGVSEVFRKLFAESGMTIAEFNKLLPETAAWLEEAQARAHGVTAEQQILNGSMEDAIRIVGGYTQAWKQLNGEMLSTDEAMLAANEALEAVKESFKENGKAITGNSTAALENRIRVGEMAAAAANAAQKKYEETGSIKAANEVYNGYIGQLRRTLTQAGLTKAQIETLIGAYTRMPESIGTTVTARTAGAEASLRTIRNTLSSLNGKTANVYVHTYYKQSEATSVRRWGGITERAQTGLLREADVYAAATTRRYAFAEAETGGEAFIPRLGNRDRSLSIGRRAMEWYDHEVVPHGSLPAAFLAGMRAAAYTPPKDPAPVLDPLVLTQAVRAAMIGVTVQLDGRTVGYITGRDADLLARA